MQDSVSVLLTVEINDYKQRADAVYYKVELTADHSKNWTVEKKFKDFEDLHKALAKKLPNMPNLPTKSIFSFSGDNPDKRKQELESYLNNLSTRADALSCTEFRNFIELENHVKVEKFNKMKKICEIQNLPMACKDFAYSPSKGIFYALLSEANVISKIGAFINTFSNPNTKEELSCVIAYKEEEPGSLEFVKLWKSGFEQEASVLCWSEGLTILAIGFTTGMIICLRVSTEHDYSKYDQYCKIHCHTQTVTGICLVTDAGYLISIGLDKYLIKTDIAHDDKQVAEKEHPNPLTALLYDKTYRRVFISDSIGTTFIYSPDDKFIHLFTIQFPFENYVKCMHFDPNRNILLSGSNQGTVGIFEIGRNGKEKLSTLTGTFDSLKNIRALHFYGNKKEVYVANGNGQVALINTLTTQAFHILDAHTDEISQMVYHEGKCLMITSSKDKSIRFWRYPYDSKENLNSNRSAVVGERKQTNQTSQGDSKLRGNIKASLYGSSTSSTSSSTTSSTKQTTNQKTTEASKKKKHEDDDEEEEDRREPPTFLKYTPAIDPKDRKNSDGEDYQYDDDEDEEVAYTKSKNKNIKKPVQKKRQDSSDEEKPKVKSTGNKKVPKRDDSDEEEEKPKPKSTTTKKIPQKQDSDEEEKPKPKATTKKPAPISDEDNDSDDDNKRKGPESSPKSFLFKNSIETTITKEEIKAVTKEKKDQSQTSSKPAKLTEAGDPLLGASKPKDKPQSKPVETKAEAPKIKETFKSEETKVEVKSTKPEKVVEKEPVIEKPPVDEMEAKMQEMARKMKEMEEEMKRMQQLKEQGEVKKKPEPEPKKSTEDTDPLESSKAKPKKKPAPEPIYEKNYKNKSQKVESDEEPEEEEQPKQIKKKQKEPDFQLTNEDDELSGWNS